MNGIRLGKMDRVLTVQKRVVTPDEAGGFDESWQESGSTPVIYASVRAIGAGQRQRVGQTVQEVSHRIVTPYRSDLAAGMRLVDGGEVYVIRAVLDVAGGREYLEILATSGGGE